MGVSKRFVFLLLFGLVFLSLSIYWSNSLTIFILYNIIGVSLLFLDYFISIDSSSIEVKRLGSEKLSLFNRELISFEIYNKSPFELRIEIKDEIPDFHFEKEYDLVKAIIPSCVKKKIEYPIMPTKRGAFTFGKLHIRYTGRLKLCSKYFKAKTTREYKVYPNMENFKKYRLSICNNRMFKKSQQYLKMLGDGTSFESLREYVYGDEYKKINWKATARANKPIINQYQPEKNQHVYMFIDTGRAMSYTINGFRKLDLVVNTALVLSDIINQNGDQSAVLLFNTEVNNIVLPGKGVEHRKKIMETLYHIDYNNNTSNYGEAFRVYKRRERHRSIIFLFTDFATEEEAVIFLKEMPLITRNNIVIVILLKNESIERIKEAKIKDNQNIYNKGVAIEILHEREKIIKLLNHKGIYCIECPAEKLEYTAINKYIEVKNKLYF